MTSQERMMQDRMERNKDLMRRGLEGIINGHDSEKIREFVADRFVDHSIFGETDSMEQLIQNAEEMDSAFPDQHLDIHDVIAEGDKVVVRSIYSGTHKGNFAGMPPTGKMFSIVEIDIFRIEGDKVVEHWDAADTASMERQLGLKLPSGSDL